MAATTDIAPKRSGSYALDSAWHAERQRLDSLTRLYDSRTLGLCADLGLHDGWRCIDVGAGTGSLAEAMAARVGTTGRVLAVDVDTRFLEAIKRPNLDIARVDVVLEDLPDSEFDLAHARLLLEHLPQRDAVLRAMVGSLRPGGWVLIEDFDWSTALSFDPDCPVAEKVAGAIRTLLASHGYDPHYGRRLPRALQAVGLADVQTHAQSMQVRGSRSHGIPQWQLLVEQLSGPLQAAGLVDQEDLDVFTAFCHDDDTVCFAPLMVSAWGRRPA